MSQADEPARGELRHCSGPEEVAARREDRGVHSISTLQGIPASPAPLQPWGFSKARSQRRQSEHGCPTSRQFHQRTNCDQGSLDQTPPPRVLQAQ